MSSVPRSPAPRVPRATYTAPTTLDRLMRDPKQRAVARCRGCRLFLFALFGWIAVEMFVQLLQVLA